MNGKLQSRKFILTAASLTATFAALFAGKLTGSECVALVPLIIGIFTGGNVVAKHKAFTEEV
jgi:hypothetical protein